MADNGSSRPLIAAFSFGVVANAAVAAACLSLNVKGRPILQDSLRLVLVIFLSASALWAIVDFIALTISSASACQLTVAFGAAFDQLARTALLQFLFWTLNGGIRISMANFAPQAAIILRFVLGGVFVGFQRSDFNPVCIPRAEVLALGVATLVADALIIAFLLIKHLSGSNSAENGKGKSLLLGIAGTGVWTATSAPMVIGVSEFDMLLRTLLPAIGLVIVIAIMMLAKDRLVVIEDSTSKFPPEEPPTEHYQMRRVTGTNGTSWNATQLPTTERPQSQYDGARRGETRTSVSASAAPAPTELTPEKGLPNIRPAQPGQSNVGIGGVPVKGQLFPPVREDGPSSVGLQKSGSKKFKAQKKGKGRPVISAPVLPEDGSSALARVPTIDLETAVQNDKERRAKHPRPLNSHGNEFHNRSASEPPQPQTEALSPTAMMNLQRTKSAAERKSVKPQEDPVEQKTQLEPIVEKRSVFSMTSSAQLSPGSENLRQRSPRQSTDPFQDDNALQPAPLKTPATYSSWAISSTTSEGGWEARSVPANEMVTVLSPPALPIEPPPRSPLRDRAPVKPPPSQFGASVEPPPRSPLREQPVVKVSEESSEKPSEVRSEVPFVNPFEDPSTKPSEVPSARSNEEPAANSPEETPLKPVQRLPAISSVRPSAISSVRPSARPPVRPVRRPPVESFVEPSDKVVEKPCGEEPPERPTTLSRTPSAKGLGAMTQSSRPNGTSQHRRSRSRSNSRSRKKDVMFTDPNAPPPIPQQCTANTASVSEEDQPVTPPNQTANEQEPVIAVETPEKKDLLDAKTTSPQNKLSPSKPEGRLTLFPPTNYGKGMLGSPDWANTAKGTSPMAAQSIALAGILTPSQRQAFEAANAHKGESGMSGLALRDSNAGPIHTRSISVPVDKPLPKSPGLVARVRESVLNRPRPIPRTPETSQVLHSHTRSQGQGFRGHRRSISLDTIKTKGSIVHATPLGSPSNLPPLPPIPQVTESTRGYPNNTKSMTFEEKMDMFYSDSTSSHLSVSSSVRRRSTSMPELPQFPSPPHDMPMEMRNQPRPDSEVKPETRTDRSSMTTVRTQSILEMREFDGFKNALNAMSNGNPAASQEDVREPGEFKESSSSTIQARSREGGSQDSSSNSHGASDFDGFEDDVTITSSSMLSPGQEFTIQQARPIRVGGPSPPQIPGFTAVGNVAPSDSVNRRGDQIGTNQTRSGQNSEGAIQQPNYPPPFHHRVGERCPGFTTRKRSVRTRRGPPPAPLLLNPPAKTQVVEAEPSPAESLAEDDESLKVVDQQLQRLERSSQVSEVDRDQRMTLLADLEKEMGAQEDQWRKMRHTIIRDSLSTVNASPSENVDQVAALWAKAQETHGSQLFNAGPSKLQNKNARADTSSIRDSLNRLSVPGSRMSYVAVSNATISPTPPDTDEEEDDGVDDELAMAYMQSMQMAQQSTSPKLWRWEAPSPTITKMAPSLWSPSFGPSAIAPGQADLAAPGPRANGGKPLQSLEIHSSQLWTPPVASPQKVLPTGLWGVLPATTVAVAAEVVPESRSQTKPKPLALKPVRKTKRNTALPDILESPQPLPEKRGTLGIFQFPWGEKSHTGVVPPPTTNPAAMPGTMTSGSAMINPMFAGRNVNQGTQPSFFDDNDEEDVGDNFSDYSDSDDEGDDFDETTIWEIASLLQGNQSGESKLRVTPSEWMGSSERTSMAASPTAYTDNPNVGVSPVAFEDDAPKPTQAEGALLWKRKSLMFQSAKHQGLTQPDNKIWNSYVQASSSSSRPPKRRADHAMIYSQELWSTPARTEQRASNTLLWSPGMSDGSVEGSSDASARSVAAPQMWKKESPVLQSVKHQGLSQPDSKTWNSYIQAASSSSRPPKRRADHAVISSHELWSAPAPTVEMPSQGLLWSTGSSDAPARTGGTPQMWKKESLVLQSVKHQGLSQPDNNTWTSYVQAAFSSARPPKRRVDHAVISSQELWSSPAPPVEVPSHTLLWSPGLGNVSGAPARSLAVTQLWAAPLSPEYQTAKDGMWIQQQMTAPMSPTHQLAGLDMRPMARKQPDELPDLRSRNLWRPISSVLASPNWLAAPEGQMPAKTKIEAGGLTRPHATAADWDAALAEAMRASHAGTLRPRITAADWDAALAEAIQASQPIGSQISGPIDNDQADNRSLWSMPPSQPPSPEIEGGMWRPSTSSSSRYSPSEPSSPVRAPRYDRKTVAIDSTTFIAQKPYQDQDLWTKAMMEKDQTAPQRNWLSLSRSKSQNTAAQEKAKKKRTWVGDVAMVEQYLQKRWGGV